MKEFRLGGIGFFPNAEFVKFTQHSGALCIASLFASMRIIRVRYLNDFEEPEFKSFSSYLFCNVIVLFFFSNF